MDMISLWVDWNTLGMDEVTSEEKGPSMEPQGILMFRTEEAE